MLNETGNPDEGQHLMTASYCAGKRTYAGLFVVTLATLMFEVLLTRIFSVTLWYHFAFMAISLAMLGMAAGAVSVYLHPDDYKDVSRLKRQMALSSLLFGLSALLSFLVHREVPFIPQATLAGLFSISCTYFFMSAPFFFSGVCVSACLTKFPAQINKLYAADLTGAALGCLLLIWTLKVTDGPSAVVLVTALGSLGAALFAADGDHKTLFRAALASAILFAALAAVNTELARNQSSPLRLKWTKSGFESRVLYEKWNPFSRIVVARVAQNGPGQTEDMGPTLETDQAPQELGLSIDAAAETRLTEFHGDLGAVEPLKHDVRNLVYYLRTGSNVLIVGAGAGRDVLSALAFGENSVRAVEFNQDILNTVNGRYGDFTGHLDRNPKVVFVNDEARSYIARLHESFDIIQISFVDTWAATAAGGFALTENSLYTREAWKLFLERLTSRGILSVTRWYVVRLPAEAYRLVSLASAALSEQGITDPRQHIMMVRFLPRTRNQVAPYGAATILVSKTAFSASDLQTVERVAQRLQLDVILTAEFALDSTFATLVSGKDLNRFAASFPLNIAPPTDDRPFFFNMLRLRDVFKAGLRNEGTSSFGPYLKSALILVVLFAIVSIQTLLCIIVPLVRKTTIEPARGAVPELVFFGSIGFGFMLVEVSQIQRLTIFLGHPTYGLSVVLFVLLLSSGLGSYATRAVGNPGAKPSALVALLLLLGVMALMGLLTPLAIHAFSAAATLRRILVATSLLFPLGLVMGTAFPVGLKLAARRLESLTPWLWGVNGATSVCGSVLAVMVSLSAGISSCFWAGFLFYAVAVGAFAFTWLPLSDRGE